MQLANVDSSCIVNGDPIRSVERQSILNFLTEHSHCFQGRVLDYGCGSQPYRALVESQGAEYIPHDLGGGIVFNNGVISCPPFNVVLLTQVVQYLDNPWDGLASEICDLLTPNGTLIMTYPTSWDDLSKRGDCYQGHCDKWRFTQAGMESMIEDCGRFRILHHELRAAVHAGSFRFPLGYGLIAQKAAS